MKKQQIKTGLISIVAGVLAPAALIVPSVSSATVNWSGYAEESDNTTMNIANWFDAVPVDGDSAVFGVAGGRRRRRGAERHRYPGSVGGHSG